MKTSFIKLSLFIISLFIITTSCSTTESDYIGKYQTYVCLNIKVADGMGGLMSVYRSADQRRTAKVYNVLGSVTLDIFKDASDKNKLIGEGTFTRTAAENFSMRPHTTREDLKFDLKNFHLENDTLKFQIVLNGGLGQQRGISGLLFKAGEKTIMGLAPEFSGIHNYTNKNPLYINKTKSMAYYSIVKSNEDELVKGFYIKQVSELTDSIKREKVKDNKEIMENSIEAIKVNYLK